MTIKKTIILNLIVLLASCSCNKNISNQTALGNIEITAAQYQIDDELDEQELDEQEIESELIVYSSGLKCEILHNGPTNSKLPARGQKLTVHYSCWYNRNNEPAELVSSSYDQDTPVEFKIGMGDVIAAWDEALMDMRVGDKWRLYVPSELAFGATGSSQLIAGDSDLIYDIEVMAID